MTEKTGLVGSAPPTAIELPPTLEQRIDNLERAVFNLDGALKMIWDAKLTVWSPEEAALGEDLHGKALFSGIDFADVKNNHPFVMMAAMIGAIERLQLKLPKGKKDAV